MTAISHLLPEEKTVSDRLAAVRRFAGSSQEKFAEAIGLSRDQLANIESGRTVLRFLTGWSACRQLGVSQLWLATGEAPSAPFLDVALEDCTIPHNASFREVCQTEPLAKRLKARRDMLLHTWKAAQLLEETNYPSNEQVFHNDVGYVRVMVSDLLRSIPQENRDLAINAIRKTCSELFAQWGAPKDTENNPLTAKSENRKVPTVKPGLHALLDQVRRLTKGKGMKATLAAHLGVPQSRLSEWLAGKYEPSGEIALKLLYWVEPPKEHQTKSPDSAPTQSGQKTRVRKSSYEKQTQVRKKKR
jgi:transcriptional regulator with XRE-family HTH domain